MIDQRHYLFFKSQCTLATRTMRADPHNSNLISLSRALTMSVARHPLTLAWKADAKFASRRRAGKGLTAEARRTPLHSPTRPPDFYFVLRTRPPMSPRAWNFIAAHLDGRLDDSKSRGVHACEIVSSYVEIPMCVATKCYKVKFLSNLAIDTNDGGMLSQAYLETRSFSRYRLFPCFSSLFLVFSINVR